MYTISKDPDDVALVCHDCSHAERIDAFDKSCRQSPYTSSTSNAESLTRHARCRIGAPTHSEELRSLGASRLHTRAGKPTGVYAR